MTDLRILRTFRNALTIFAQDGPIMSLARKLASSSVDYELDTPPTPTELFEYCAAASPNDAILLQASSLFATWDNMASADWTGETQRNSTERRKRIYELLGMSEEVAELCSKAIPVYREADASIAITKEDVPDWYTESRRAAQNQFWKRYVDQLHKQGWPLDSVRILDHVTTEVVSHLADPIAEQASQRKGLVVGYVQSGKTANFTGVLAKALDAGYRLVIVLTGTTDILRQQTQRRLDRELFGIDANGHGQSEFKSLVQPLTDGEKDYETLRKGISSLYFYSGAPHLPTAQQLSQAIVAEPVRYAVVKKNSNVLRRLLKDLDIVKQRHGQLDLIPALIIDDESDQASINTVRPSEDEDGNTERTAINKAIVDILNLLPRCQYLGYTATPFANVFINPADAEDLFPRDFIISLPRPFGYMGVADFYDDYDAEPGDLSSNQNAHVRFVEGDDHSEEMLQQAMDSFVLAGAIKIYREHNAKARYKHHTMLVHNSPRVHSHEADRESITRMFEASGYVDGTGHERLKALWQTDYEPVCKARSESGFPVPKSFAEIRPLIAECVNRMYRNGRPVLVVNGQRRDDTPDFNDQDVWAIIIGGTKLSRGYTVEGLTVSFYRRKAGAADTLMQMGRWFGYRRGYRDLVRLYIGTHEPAGASKYMNLYEAFRAVCYDEEYFRGQLTRFAGRFSEQKITPIQVPPLVPSHMLRPTSANKMYNAVLEERDYGGDMAETTMMPAGEAKRENFFLTERLLENVQCSEVEVRFDVTKLSADGDAEAEVVKGRGLIWRISPADVLKWISEYRWLPSTGPKGPREIALIRKYLSRPTSDTHVNEWLVYMPLPASKGTKQTVEFAGREIVVRERSRVITGERFRVFSEPRDVKIGRGLSMQRTGEDRRLPDRIVSVLPADEATRKLCAPDQGVVLLYPVNSEAESEAHELPTMGFALLFPKGSGKGVLTYSVADRSKAEDAVVDVPVEARTALSE